MANIYSWISFDIDKALAGTIVGFKRNNSLTDLSWTGKLSYDDRQISRYKVIIDGITVYVDSSGNVLETNPESSFTGTLLMVTADLGSQAAQGAIITRDASDYASLLQMQPRDHFAVNVLKEMLKNVPQPEAVDDATRIFYCRSAYR